MFWFLGLFAGIILRIWAILHSSVIADLYPFYGWFFPPGSSSISVDLCYPNMFGSRPRVVGGFPVPGLWAVFLCPGCGLELSMVVMLGYPVCGVLF